jgi:serine/threonine protein kinase
MGEVYKARDTRLGRFVAVKVLSSDSAADEKRRERLRREANAVAQLSHPHICTLYDAGSDGRTDFLVMELLEGEALAERLARGPLPLALALEYGKQIAEALDTAHRRGIVHRDLKPANVMLTKAGVKVLDFGLAKREAPTRALSSSARSGGGPARAGFHGSRHLLIARRFRLAAAKALRVTGRVDVLRSRLRRRRRRKVSHPDTVRNADGASDSVSGRPELVRGAEETRPPS